MRISRNFPQADSVLSAISEHPSFGLEFEIWGLKPVSPRSEESDVVEQSKEKMLKAHGSKFYRACNRPDRDNGMHLFHMSSDRYML